MQIQFLSGGGGVSRFVKCRVLQKWGRKTAEKVVRGNILRTGTDPCSDTVMHNNLISIRKERGWIFTETARDPDALRETHWGSPRRVASCREPGRNNPWKKARTGNLIPRYCSIHRGMWSPVPGLCSQTVRTLKKPRNRHNRRPLARHTRFHTIFSVLPSDAPERRLTADVPQ